MSEEPVRLRLDPSSDDELRATLEAARGDHHDDERLARLALRLGPLFTPPGGGGGGGGGGGPTKAATTAASAAAKGSALVSAAKGLALVAALGAAGTVVWIERTPPTQLATRAAPSEPAEPAPARPLTSTEAEAPRELPAPEGAREPTLEAPPTTATVPRAPRRAPSTTDEAIRTPAPPTSPTVDPEPPSPPAVETTPRPTELALVRGAMRALASSPETALAQADEHARLYPDGAMREDREVVAIDALVHLGRRAEAEARAERFRAAHPSSPLLRRIDRILGR